MMHTPTALPADDEVVRFGYDDQTFHVQLPPVDAARLRKELHRYIAVARRATAPHTRRLRMNTAQRAENQRIRDWAATTPGEQSLPARGRIPNATRARYHLSRAAAVSGDRANPGQGQGQGQEHFGDWRRCS